MNQNEHIPDHQLQAYLDQALDPAASQAVKNHLEGCPACREEYARLENLVIKINGLPEIQLGSDLSSLVLDQLRDEKLIPRGITWTLVLEAIGAGAAIGTLIPALRAVAWMPRLLDTQNQVQAAINIFFTQLASSWLVWWAGIRMELSQAADGFFSGSHLPDIAFSPWILIMAAGGLGIFINYLILRADADPIRSVDHKNQ